MKDMDYMEYIDLYNLYGLSPLEGLFKYSDDK